MHFCNSVLNYYAERVILWLNYTFIHSSFNNWNVYYTMSKNNWIWPILYNTSCMATLMRMPHLLDQETLYLLIQTTAEEWYSDRRLSWLLLARKVIISCDTYMTRWPYCRPIFALPLIVRFHKIECRVLRTSTWDVPGNEFGKFVLDLSDDKMKVMRMIKYFFFIK